MIDVQSAAFVYPETFGSTILDITVRLNGGDRVLLIGHNGCGKSTLLSLLAGKRKPKAGTVRVLQRDPFDDFGVAQHISFVGPPWPPEAYFANTVDRVTSPAPDPERKAALAQSLHLRRSRFIDRMSSGEKRRVQILHGMLNPAAVYLLDECSTDIDVAERKTVLKFVRSECEARGGCCIYATHILDRVGDWATHLMLMEAGRIVRFISVKDIAGSLEDYAFDFMARCAATRTAFKVPTAAISDIETGSEIAGSKGGDRRYISTDAERADGVIVCKDLSFKDVFTKMSFTIYRGERVLLAGCNGAGKSTLLNMLGGKQFFDNSNGALRVLGKACYDDMTLNASIAYGGDWWVTVPGGEVHVNEMLSVKTPRAVHLCKLLSVNLDWDVRHISAGERRRVQLLLFLLEDKPLVLLDEATAELDLDQRHQLLQYLYEESVCRGVTVVYSTHIFGGLDGWASAVVILDRTKRGVHAVWRPESADVNDEKRAINLDDLTEELVKLKTMEEF